MQVCFGFIKRLQQNTYRYLCNNFKISSNGTEISTLHWYYLQNVSLNMHKYITVTMLLL